MGNINAPSGLTGSLDEIVSPVELPRDFLLNAQKHALEMVVQGAPLRAVLVHLTQVVERHAPDATAAILLLDDRGRLVTGAAPSLPDHYNRAIDGLVPRCDVGTCGAAAATGQVVITPNLDADPNWRELKSLPLGLGLKSAWSQPIIAQGRVLGTFGTYFRECREPSDFERRMVGTLSHTAALAIEARAQERQLRDLTEKLERRVEERTQQRDRVWRNARDMLAVIAADGALNAVSPSWTGVLGYAPEEVTGRNFFQFVAATDLLATRGTLEAAIAAKRPANFVCRCRHRDGTLHWISWRSSAEGDLIYANGRDITAEKTMRDNLARSEARLRSIFETSYQYQGLLDTEGRLLEANPASLQGIRARLSEVVGKLFWETPWFTGTPGASEKVRADVARVAKGETVRQEIEVNLPEGGWRCFDFTMRPVRDLSGVVIAIVPEAVEVTERRRAEAALARRP